MKQLITLMMMLISLIGFAQEGTKQFMPNETDRLWLEIYRTSSKRFATYRAEDRERLYIHLNTGEKMHFGMKMSTVNTADAVFRIKGPDSTIVFAERAFPFSGAGYISTYNEAVTGPENVIINGTTIPAADGYTPLVYTATSTGAHFIEFETDPLGDRFYIEFFDVTVTDAANNVITNPGEPNKSAGRLYSKGWGLTTTSYTQYPVKADFYVFTADEFVNKVQYEMKPFAFNFVTNSYGVKKDPSLDVIERAQSQDGDLTNSADISEYRIFLNDPDRGVFQNTALPPPIVKVWIEDILVYDYDYDRNPQLKPLYAGTVNLEMNRPTCTDSSVAVFRINTNIEGFTTILIDVDGSGFQTGGRDVALNVDLNTGDNYILWDMKDGQGNRVTDGEYSASATFLGRGPAHFPLYDVESLSNIETSSIRPFNKLGPTLYWDDSQVGLWGDQGSGTMSETKRTQLTIDAGIPRIWTYNGNNYNGNVSTFNSWFNAIDLGLPSMKFTVITSDTKCVDGDRPFVGDVHKDTTINASMVFKASDFTQKFFDPYNKAMTQIQISSLPGNGELQLSGAPVGVNDEIPLASISQLSFVPNTDFTGRTTFLWNGSNGTDYATEADTVFMIFNTDPTISEITDQTICTNQDLTDLAFTIGDTETAAADLNVIAYSHNTELIRNESITLGGSGASRTISISPKSNASGSAIIYVKVDDGLTEVIEEFTLYVGPSITFQGDTTICDGDDLRLTSEEFGADSYAWSFGGTVLSTTQVLERTNLTQAQTGTYTLAISKGGCTANRDFNVSIAPLVTFSGVTEVCEGELLSLSATETVATSYSWRKSGSEIASTKVFEIANMAASNVGNDYSLRVTKEGCTNTSDNFSISMISTPDLTLAISGSTVTKGDDGTLTINNSQNGVTYRAYINDFEVSNGLGTGSNISLNIIAAYLQLGDNTVVVKADNGGCELTMNNSATIHTNAVPVANRDEISVDEDSNVSHDPSNNDNGLENGLQSINITVGATQGTAIMSGNDIQYTPNPAFHGTDSLTYEICDVDGDCSSAKVIITVNSVNDTPVAVADNYSMNEDGNLSSDVSSNDTGKEDLPISFSVVNDVDNGTLSLNNDGTFTYDPAPGFNGSDAFTYQLCDGDPECSQATVSITVDPVNDLPVAVNDNASTNEDIPVNVSVLSNDGGLEDLPISVSIIDAPTQGTASMNGDNSIRYEPDLGFHGTDSLEYQVCDGSLPADCATAKIYFTVNSVNSTPVPSGDNSTTDEDNPVSTTVLSNDTGLGDGPITVTVTADPGKGNATVNPDNTITYTPNPGIKGSDSYTYQVCDIDGECATAIVNITINSVNDTPVANNDASTTDEDTAVDIDVLGNDSGLEDTPIALTIASAPANGSVAINPDNTIKYTPNAGHNGSDSFQYQVCDADATPECSTTTVNLTINSVNDVPAATADAATTDEGDPVSIPVLDNDTGLEDGLITVTIQTAPGKGSVVVNPDNSITYTPAEGENGSDSFTYRVCDGDGECSTANVNLTINSVDDIPVAVADMASTDEDTPASISILSNDTGLLDKPITVSVVTGASNGTATLNPDNTVSYAPNAGFNGTDSFTYQICDVDNDCSQATVSITVNPVNDTPVANNDAATTVEDTAVDIDVLGNDTDLEDTPIALTIASAPANGSVAINPDNTIKYTPNAGHNGSDSFQYQVCDADATPECSTATVNVTINSVNDVPAATADAATTDEGDPVSIPVLDNDTGLEDGLITVTIQTSPGKGSAVVNPDNSITYTPAEGENGSDSFTYRVCDGDGECSTANVNLTINSVDDIPVAVADMASTDEDTPASISILTNDTGLLDKPIAVSMVTGASNGTATLNPDNTVSYAPNAGFNGADSFTYQICDVDNDCSQATVSITVNPVNDTPVANNDAATTDEDTAVDIDVLDNDTDLEDTPIGITISGVPSKGNAVVNPDNTVTYTPNPGENGSDSFTYQVCDANNDCVTATVNVTINSVNDLPVATGDNVTTDEDLPATTPVLDNDSGMEDGGITVSIATNPVRGSLSINPDNSITYTPNPGTSGNDSYQYELCDGDGDCSTATVNITVNAVDDIPVANTDAAITDEDANVNIDILGNDTGLDDGIKSVSIQTPTGNGTVTVNPDNTVTYTPDPAYNGPDSFVYEVCDNDDQCATATVNITVNSVNQTPVANDDAASTDENSAVDINVLANDTDMQDGGIAVSIASPASNGTATVNPDNSINYEPNPGYLGSDAFDYQLCDGDGDCSTATVSMTIDNVDYKPVANDDGASVDEDDQVIIDVLGNDSDLEDRPIGLTITSQPTDGNVTVNPDFTVTYTPDPAYNGADSFVYEVCDSDNDCSAATVNITVNSVNDLPVANNDAASLNEDESINGDVSSNDTGLEDGPISFTLINDVSNGQLTLNNDGSYTYQPNPSYNGSDSFRYRVCDNDGDCDEADVAITVISINDIPVANDDNYNTAHETPVSGDVSTNDSGKDDAPITYSVSTEPANGSLVLNADGTFIFTPDADFGGDDSFVYAMCDGDDDCATATVSIQVESGKELPQAFDDAASTILGETVQVDVLSNDTGLQAGGLSVSIQTQPSYGTVSINADNSISYTANDSYIGNDSFEYTVCDADNDCSTATVSITISTNDTDGDGITDEEEGEDDPDQDGIPSDEDLDSDGDGISDEEEGNTDTDGDGTPDYKDIDSDGDGIPDEDEGNKDTDGDGDPDYKDLDSDDDGIPDANELPGDCDQDGIPNLIDEDQCTEVTVPEGFSPNGDGINDYFVIPELSSFTSIEITIFNRWGNIVYSENPYNNDWDGRANAGSSLGTELPVGTYYYIVKIKDTGENLTGYVYLTR